MTPLPRARFDPPASSYARAGAQSPLLRVRRRQRPELRCASRRSGAPARLSTSIDVADSKRCGAFQAAARPANQADKQGYPRKARREAIGTCPSSSSDHRKKPRARLFVGLPRYCQTRTATIRAHWRLDLSQPPPTPSRPRAICCLFAWHRSHPQNEWLNKPRLWRKNRQVVERC